VLENPVFVLFVIVTLGYFLGLIRFGSFSLEASGIVIVAMIFGHFGFIVPSAFRIMGLTLFLYTIGLQAGPGFIESFKKSGRQLTFMAFITVGTAALLTVILGHVFNISSDLSVGLFAGSLTSTPGLAAATEASGSPLASLGYGVAYPVGIIGTILTLRFIPRLFRVRIHEAEEAVKREKISVRDQMEWRIVRVTNKNVQTMTIKDLNLDKHYGVTISRILRDGDSRVPKPGFKLKTDDLIRIVGTREGLDKAALMLGEVEQDVEIPLPQNRTVLRVLVNNPEYVGKQLGDHHLEERFNVIVTRVRRSGIDLPPTPERKLHMGDILQLVGDAQTLEMLSERMGANLKNMLRHEIVPVSLGIVLGMLVGSLQFGSENGVMISLGLSGGIIFTSLFLGYKGVTGPITWVVTGHTNRLLRDFGLVFFLSSVGTEAGAGLMETIRDQGVALLVMAFFITIIPMLLTAIAGMKWFKLNLLTVLGTITGGMTNTPGLGVVNKMSDSDAVNAAYAAVYPFALVLMIAFAHVLIKIW
jgi:putative transport protein